MAEKKKRSKPEDIDIDMLIEEFNSPEERIEYIFSDINFEAIRKLLAMRPKREDFSDMNMDEKIKAFVRTKK